jgi:hypothetical protein
MVLPSPAVIYRGFKSHGGLNTVINRGFAGPAPATTQM